MTLRGLLADPGIVGAWSLVPERSSIRFTNRTLWGLMKVNGRFRTLRAVDTSTRAARCRVGW